MDVLPPRFPSLVCEMGTWSPTPVCRPARCRQPLQDNGVERPKTPYQTKNGTLVLYEGSCSHEARTIRPKTALCFMGKWVVTEAHCDDESQRLDQESSEKQNSKPCLVPKLGRGKMGKYEKGSSADEVKFAQTGSGIAINSGETLLLLCNENFELPVDVLPQGDVEVVCEMGTWNPTPACHPARCREPLQHDGIVRPISPYENFNGSTARYENSCPRGERTVRAKTALCLMGSWIVTEALCWKDDETEVKSSSEMPNSSPCSVPFLGQGKLGKYEKESNSDDQTFVQKNAGAKIYHGEKLMLRCNKSFELPVDDLTPGDIEIVCENGTLKPKPACFPARCRKPLPEDGRGKPLVPYSRQHDSIVHYEGACAVRTVQEKQALCYRGTWIVTPPICTDDNRCSTEDLKYVHIVTEGKAYYEDRESIIVQCQNKYEKTLVDDILCVNGQWQISRAPCKPASCRFPPPAIEGGKTDISSAEHGGVVTYNCFGTKVLEQKDPVTCSYGQWIGELPTCKDDQCNTKEFEKFEGVRLEKRTFRDKEYYSIPCSEGYDSANVTVQCDKGRWIGAVNGRTICSPAPHGTTPSPLVTTFLRQTRPTSINGAEEQNPEFNNTVDEMEELQQNGAENETKLENETMPEVFQDSSKSCLYLSSDPNLLVFLGETVVNGGTSVPHNSNVMFGCERIGMYRLHGYSEITCVDGEWQPKEFPKCRSPEKGQDVLMDITTNDTYEIRPGNVALVTEYSRVNVLCYEQDRRLTPILRASVSNGLLVTQNLLDSHYQPFSYISISSMTQNEVGPYSCSSQSGDHHEIVLSLRRKKSGCSPPHGLQNEPTKGEVFAVGDAVNYTCLRGFRLTGSQILICQENGEWSDKPPICSEIHCPVPSESKNGFFHINSSRVNSIISYKCKQGYKLVGEPDSRCDENGQWSNDPPICEEEPVLCDSYELFDMLPEGVAPANITAERMPSDSIIELACDGKSLVMLEKKYAVCSSKGFWIVDHPQCVIGCLPIQTPENSTLIIHEVKLVYRFGEPVTFSCPEDQELSSILQLIVCTASGWSDKELPECIPRIN